MCNLQLVLWVELEKMFSTDTMLSTNKENKVMKYNSRSHTTSDKL